MSDRYLHTIDEAFSGPAWHGPALLGSLRGVDAGLAAWRPGPGRHCIWELVLHAAYWKYIARRRITGGERGSFGRKGSNFPALPEPLDEPAWRSDIEFLKQEHERLREVVTGLRDRDFQRPADSRWTVAQTIRGAALHDVYHAGQIQLIRRLADRE